MVEPVLIRLHPLLNCDEEDDYYGVAHVYVESLDGSREAVFYIRILTTYRLMQLFREGKKVMHGRSTYIMERGDSTAVEEEIKMLLKGCIRPTWTEVVEAINRYMEWEYDTTTDYVESMEFMKRWGILDRFEE